MPYNLEAEQSFLGAILFDNTSIENTMDLIKDYHLYEPLHQEIYQACLILFDNNKLADPTTLKGYLKDENPNRKIDISDYLNKVTDILNKVFIAVILISAITIIIGGIIYNRLILKRKYPQTWK